MNRATEISQTLNHELQRGMRLLLIDLSHLWWAAWHASADQELGQAYEITLDRVDKIQRTVEHDLCAICCDAAPYWRSEINPEYKANRQAAPPMALGQFQRVREKLEARGELLWRHQGYEADDVIAHACRVAEARGMVTTIATNDKDLLQLVSDSTSVFNVSKWETWGPADVEERMGVAPKFIAQQLALMGDKGDNVVGIPSVGLKNAAKLITQFGDANKALQAARADDETITPALRKALATYWERYGAALIQIELTRDVDGFDFDSLFRHREQKPEPAEWDDINDMGDEMEAEKQETKQSEPPPSPQATEAPASAPEPKTEAIVKAPSVMVPWELQLEPQDIRSAYKMATVLADSKLFRGFPTEQAIFAVLARGRTLGIDATTALSSFHIIEGRPAMHADLIEALVLKSGKAEYFDCVETTAQKAVYETKRVGSKRVQTEVFTIQDAARAMLVVASDAEGSEDGFIGTSKEGPNAKSNWSKWRKTMLRHRAKTQLARRVYPDVVLGLYTADEVSNGDVFEAEFEER